MKKKNDNGKVQCALTHAEKPKQRKDQAQLKELAVRAITRSITQFKERFK